jgi:ubiquinone/menaquinone biosynthesis C-methylase UbiE
MRCSVCTPGGQARHGQRVLDAGCGTGLSILALTDALRSRGFACQPVDAFDLTEAMLARCRETIWAAGLPRVAVRQADALHLGEQVPESWRGDDLIVCASMLEYVPRDRLTAVVAALGRGVTDG